MSAITLKRSIVNSIAPVRYYLGNESFMGSSTQPRMFIDSLNLNGIAVAKNIIAIDGGAEISTIADETAACVIISVNIERSIKSCRIDMEIGIIIDSETRGKIETQLEALNNSTSSEKFKVTFGASNKKQEFKTDQKWGNIMDFSSFEMYTDRSSRGSIEAIHDSSNLTDSSVGSGAENFEVLSLQGFITDVATLDVGFAASDENGILRLNSVKSK